MIVSSQKQQIIGLIDLMSHKLIPPEKDIFAKVLEEISMSGRHRKTEDYNEWSLHAMTVISDHVTDSSTLVEAINILSKSLTKIEDPDESESIASLHSRIMSDVPKLLKSYLSEKFKFD